MASLISILYLLKLKVYLHGTIVKGSNKPQLNARLSTDYKSMTVCMRFKAPLFFWLNLIIHFTQRVSLRLNAFNVLTKRHVTR